MLQPNQYPLQPSDCPFIAADAVESFNRLARLLDGVSRQLPNLWADLSAQAERKGPAGLRKEELPLLRRFLRLRDLIQRRRCRVGYLGRSQAGKSSTLNNVLGVTADEGPTSPAAGAPGTSNSTRIFALPPGQKPTCKVAFLTPDEYEERRLVLCKFLALDPEAELGDLIEEVRDRVAKDRAQRAAPAGTEAPVDDHADHAADREYFLRFLTSYRQYGGAYVREPRREDDAEYARRHEYTNHLQGEQASPYLLLREVIIGFPTDAVSADLEMLDLPGLGARMMADDLLTESFLNELDGALIFQSSEQVQSREAYDLAVKLRSRFGDMAGRVWMVVTRFDGLSPVALNGDRNGVTILDNLSQALGHHRIPHQQVLLVGNVLYKQIKASPGGKANEGVYRLMLNLDVKDGEPVLPEKFARHATLCQAYKKFLADGGIGELHEVVGRRLAVMVKEKLREEVASEIRVLADQVGELLAFAKERAGMKLEDIANALAWKDKVKLLAARLDRERALVEGPGRVLKSRLHARFKQVRPDAEQESSQEELAQNHRTVRKVLSAEALLAAREETLPTVYENVQKALQRLCESAGLREVRLASGLGPPAVLEENRKNDVAQPAGYLAPFEALRDEDLFPDYDRHERRQFLTGGQYGQVMEMKIDVIVHEAVHLMADRVKAHLRELARQLGLLGSDGRIDALEEEVIQGLIQAAQEV